MYDLIEMEIARQECENRGFEETARAIAELMDMVEAEGVLWRMEASRGSQGSNEISPIN